MIERCFDAEQVNELINEPSIRPTVGGEGALEATTLLADRRNVCLLAEGGGAMFRWTGPGVYEGHSFFRVRGKEALSLGRAMIACMGLNYGATLIWGLTPTDNKAARWFNRKLGFRSLGPMQSPDGWGELFEMRF
jgi:hypothetical protein